MFCDNQSAIHLRRHQAYQERTKHIDVKLFFIIYLIEKEEVAVEKIDTYMNPADSFTKALATLKFELCSSLDGLN